MAGNHRLARRFFKAALVDPTENSVAQVRWGAEVAHVIQFDPKLLLAEHSYEAQCWHAFGSGDWNAAYDAAVAWLEDQPFSTTPAILASYLAAIAREDYAKSKEIADSSLAANPGNPMLTNNLAYALIHVGELERSRRLLASMATNDIVSRVSKLATSGLLAFRAGEYEVGRKHYRASIEAAHSRGLRRLHAKASIFYAMEEARLDRLSEHTVSALKQVLAACEGIADADVKQVRDKLSSSLGE
ncbi:MAG: hypothetical protein K2X35_00315 [Bryobacteraceae bacterium]|nr:hypothetical protein [Bryobacteraceae bacterium]